jgi:2-hydroxychromene-2-carboxylate isomerase
VTRLLNALAVGRFGEPIVVYVLERAQWGEDRLRAR